MSRSTIIILLCAFAGLLAGCADDIARQTQAVVRQEVWTQIRVQRDVDATGENAWTAQAWSAEFSGVEAQAVREAMNIIDEAGEGCVWVPRHRAYPGQSAIQFKAMGAAQLSDHAGQVHTLHPRSLALQTESIHGVIYTAQINDDGHTEWTFNLLDANGATKAQLRQETPQGWGIVAINGDTTFDNPLTLGRDESLHLFVDAEADTTLLVARSTREDARAQLVCAMDGRTLELSPALLDSVDPDHDIELELILRNQTALDRTQPDRGEASIELHDHLRLKRVTFAADLE